MQTAATSLQKLPKTQLLGTEDFHVLEAPDNSAECKAAMHANLCTEHTALTILRQGSWVAEHTERHIGLCRLRSVNVRSVNVVDAQIHNPTTCPKTRNPKPKHAKSLITALPKSQPPLNP